MSVKIIPKYIRSRFLGIFGFCLFSVVMVFIVVDLVESLDRFIDRNVPAKIIVLYYLNYVPYILVLGVPVTTLLASVFSMGTLAKNNEMVALKSLGYSLYKVMGTFLIMGLIISAVTFALSEGVVSRTNRNKEDIRRKYLEGDTQRVSSDTRNLEIQEPPDQIVTMAYFDPGKKIARRVKIETYHENQLTGRVDTDSMMWLDGSWIVLNGYKRTFEEDHETAIPISGTTRYDFQFQPGDLMKAQVQPEEMGFPELLRFIERVNQSGGEVYRWMTDLHLRIAFPMSNFIIILFSVPMAYNRRKKSLAVGFGLSLAVCFFYFGVVKVGQTLGQNGSMAPMLGAWLGNLLMFAGGMGVLVKVRK